MRATIDNLLSHSIDEVLSTSLVLDLMKIMSIIKYNGANPPSCSKCLREFYSQLFKITNEQIENMNKIKKRTLKPAWSGNKYKSKAARHFNSNLITDEEAIEYLYLGIFQESEFLTLPENYKADIVLAPVEPVEPIAPVAPVEPIAPVEPVDYFELNDGTILSDDDAIIGVKTGLYNKESFGIIPEKYLEIFPTKKPKK